MSSGESMRRRRSSRRSAGFFILSSRYFHLSISHQSALTNAMSLSYHLCRALRSIFNYHAAEHDDDSSTFIYPSQIYAIITKLGRNDEERSRMQTSLATFQEQQHPHRRDPSSSTAARASTEALRAQSSSDSSTIATIQTKEPKVALQIVTDVPVGCMTFDSFASIVDHGRQTNVDDDNECQLHFLYIINEYQKRCDSEGNYLLAEGFMNHLATLRKEEEDRVVSIVNSELANDLAKLKEAHEKQLDEFTKSEYNLIRYYQPFLYDLLLILIPYLSHYPRLGRISHKVRTASAALHFRNATSSQATDRISP